MDPPNSLSDSLLSPSSSFTIPSPQHGSSQPISSVSIPKTSSLSSTFPVSNISNAVSPPKVHTNVTFIDTNPNLPLSLSHSLSPSFLTNPVATTTTSSSSSASSSSLLHTSLPTSASRIPNSSSLLHDNHPISPFIQDDSANNRLLLTHSLSTSSSTNSGISNPLPTSISNNTHPSLSSTTLTNTSMLPPPPAPPTNQKTPQPAPFLTKIMEMLDNSDLTRYISWSENGENIVIWKVEEFAAEVLALYYKHSNYSSFVRQLHIYGFRKIKDDGAGHHEFRHPAFHRGLGDEELRAIKRRKSENEIMASLMTNSTERLLQPHFNSSSLHADASSHLHDQNSLMLSDGEMVPTQVVGSGTKGSNLGMLNTNMQNVHDTLLTTSSSLGDITQLQQHRSTTGGKDKYSKRKDRSLTTTTTTTTTRKRKYNERGTNNNYNGTGLPTSSLSGIGSHYPSTSTTDRLNKNDRTSREIKDFHKRQKEMLGKILAMENRNEQLTRDNAILLGELGKLQEQQAAIHSILQAAAAEGVEAIYTLLKKRTRT